MIALTIEDSKELSSIGRQWRTKHFEAFFSEPGAVGFKLGTNWLIGKAVEDQLLIVRWWFTSVEEREVMIKELKSMYSKLHVDFTLKKEDHIDLFAFSDLGFNVYCTGRMKVRLTME